MGLDIIKIQNTPEELQEVREIFAEYEEFIFQTVGIRANREFYQEELKNLPGDYIEAKQGAIFLAKLDNKVVACGALCKMNDDICLLKRMFVKEGYQGRGFGKQILDLAIAESKKHGYKFMRFDSLKRLEKALGLYKKYGFTEIEVEHQNPYYEFEVPKDLYFMELKLAQS